MWYEILYSSQRLRILVVGALLIVLLSFVTNSFFQKPHGADQIKNSSAHPSHKIGAENVLNPDKGTDKNATVIATGIVNAVLMVDVGSQLSGQIKDVLVDFNQRVSAGQVIARVDPETYVAAVNQAKAALNIAKASLSQQNAALQRAKVGAKNARSAHRAEMANYEAAKVKLAEEERDYNRFLALSQSDSTSDRQLTQARAAFEIGAANLKALEEQVTIKSDSIEISDMEVAIAETNLESATAVVEEKNALLEQAQVNLQRTEIRSPIDGSIIKRGINSGQTVAVSLESKTLFKIAEDLSKMEVHGRIDEADIGLIKEGQSANFTVDAYADKEFSGQVVQVRKAPEVSQGVVTYTAVISAANPDYLLFPGMTAHITFFVGRDVKTNLTSHLPNSALQTPPNGFSSMFEKEPSHKTVSPPDLSKRS